MKTKYYFSIILLSIFFSVYEKANAQVAPNWIWAKGIGGVDDELSYAITTDANGNVYTTGYFYGTVDFNPGPGVYNLSSPNYSSAFVCKLNSAGNFVWAQKLSLGDCYGWSIALDSLNNVYLAGRIEYSSTDVYSFVSKLDSSGNFLWTNQVYNSHGWSVAVDLSGNVYTTGFFWGTATFGTNNITAVGDEDIFISKLDSSGNYLWTKGIGGVNHDRGYSIYTDKSGNVYTTGFFYDSVDFNPDTSASFFISATGVGYGAFISKLDSSGNFIWAKALKGNSADCRGETIICDASGNVYAAGAFSGLVDFDPDSVVIFNLSNASNSDIFLSKLDSSGNFIWAKAMGGVVWEWGKYITLDKNNNIYTTGYFSNTVDFDPNTGVYLLTPDSPYFYEESFITKLDNSGNFQWVKHADGMNGDSGTGITCDTIADNLYVVGTYLWPTLSFDTITITK